MNRSLILAVALLAVPSSGLPGADSKKAAPAKKGATTTKKEKVTAKAEPAEAAKPSTESGPPANNLQIPADLPEKVRKELEDAIEAFKKAEKGDVGRKLLLKEAIEKLQKVAGKAPKCPIPPYYLGIAQQMKKNYPEAKKVLEKALKLNPRFFEARVELGDVRHWQKDGKGAIEEYDKALAISPEYILGIDRKCRVLLRLGRYEEAQPLVQKLMEKSPDNDWKLVAPRLETHIKGPGWPKTFKAETANYEIHTSVSEDFAKEIAGQVELIRRAYDKVFFDIDKPKRKFPIWVYANPEAYWAAGNPRQAGGHYEPFFRKLVIFKYPKSEQTRAVLYHEAFHQFLDDYLEDAPQWFNEGLAEYFGAFEYERKGSDEKMLARPNRMRLPATKQVVNMSGCPSASDLMTMTRREMYGPNAAIHYAQAWGMIYYIYEGDRPEYRKILLEYFRALWKGKDLVEAYQATFGKVDMARFDREWKGFIRALK